MSSAKDIIIAGIILSTLTLSGCCAPMGLIRTSTKEWQDVVLTNHGFSVVLPSWAHRKAYSGPLIEAYVSKAYEDKYGVKEMQVSMHPIWVSPTIEPVYLIDMDFYVVLSNSFSRFCKQGHHANRTFMTNNTNGFCFGTNILEKVIDAPRANNPGRYTCYRRDVKLIDGNVLVAVGSLWQREIGKQYYDEDCQTIRKILMSIKPLDPKVEKEGANQKEGMIIYVLP